MSIIRPRTSGPKPPLPSELKSKDRLNRAISSDLDGLSPVEFFEALEESDLSDSIREVDLLSPFDPIDAKRVQSADPKDKLILRFSNRSREFKIHYKKFLEMGCEKFLKKGQEFTVLISGPLQEESIRCELIQTRVITQRFEQIKELEKKSKDSKDSKDYVYKAFDEKTLEPTQEENKNAKTESDKLEYETGINILKFMTTYRLFHPELGDLVIFSGALTDEKKVSPKAQQKGKSKGTLKPIEKPLCGPKRNAEQIRKIQARDSHQLNADEALNETIDIKLDDYLGSAYKEEKEKLKAKNHPIFELIPWKYETDLKNKMYADAVEELTTLLNKRPDLAARLDNEAEKIAENRLRALYDKYDAESLYKLYKDWYRLKFGDEDVNIPPPLTRRGEIDREAIINHLIVDNYLKLLTHRQASTKKFLLTEFPVFIKSLMEEKERHVKKMEDDKGEKIEGAHYDGYPFGNDSSDSLGRGVYSFTATIFQNIFGDLRAWHRWINTTSLTLPHQESPKPFFNDKLLSSSPIGSAPESATHLYDHRPFPASSALIEESAKSAAEKEAQKQKSKQAASPSDSEHTMAAEGITPSEAQRKEETSPPLPKVPTNSPVLTVASLVPQAEIRHRKTRSEAKGRRRLNLNPISQTRTPNPTPTPNPTSNPSLSITQLFPPSAADRPLASNKLTPLNHHVRNASLELPLSSHTAPASPAKKSQPAAARPERKLLPELPDELKLTKKSPKSSPGLPKANPFMRVINQARESASPDQFPISPNMTPTMRSPSLSAPVKRLSSDSKSSGQSSGSPSGVSVAEKNSPKAPIQSPRWQPISMHEAKLSLEAARPSESPPIPASMVISSVPLQPRSKSRKVPPLAFASNLRGGEAAVDAAAPVGLPKSGSIDFVVSGSPSFFSPSPPPPPKTVPASRSKSAKTNRLN